MNGCEIEQLITRWYHEGQHEGITEYGFYLKEIMKEAGLTAYEAAQVIEENIDLDEEN